MENTNWKEKRAKNIWISSFAICSLSLSVYPILQELENVCASFLWLACRFELCWHWQGGKKRQNSLWGLFLLGVCSATSHLSQLSPLEFSPAIWERRCYFQDAHEHELLKSLQHCHPILLNSHLGDHTIGLLVSLCSHQLFTSFRVGLMRTGGRR